MYAMTAPTDRPSFPPAVLEALRKGNKLEAIKLLRQASKAGLAKPAGEHARPAPVGAPAVGHSRPIPGYVPHSQSGLSPGEVPRARGQSWWVVVLVLGVVAFLVLR